MAKLFLSHSHLDNEAASVLAAALSAFGHSIWLDDHLRAGSDFTGVIDAEIRAADDVIVLWSAASVDSTWVVGEATLAKDLGKLIPARIDACVPKVPFYALHTLDLGWQSELKRFKSLDALTSALLAPSSARPGPALSAQGAFSDPAAVQTAETALLTALRARSMADIERSPAPADLWLLGSALTLGVGAAKDFARARDAFERAAAGGYDRALNSLGIGYIVGDFEPKDIDRGVALVKAAADRGVAMAQSNYGLWLLRGTYMTADPEAGFSWLHRAAVAGDVNAQENVAWCHYKGEGVPRNMQEATYWFERAAAGGHGGAMNMLGALHADGVLLGSNDEKARGQFEAAWASGQVQAARYLGALYFEEKRAIYSPEKGIDWFMRAGRAGDRDAYFELARLVLASGGAHDKRVDVRWLLATAADGGSAEALVTLGELLADGRQGPKDTKLAREAFEQILGMPKATETVVARARDGLKKLSLFGAWPRLSR